HLWSETPTGQAQIVEGPMMAANDRFHIRIIGRGGHGAMPHQTVDAVVAAADVIARAQPIVPRKVDPLQPAVVPVASVHAGSAFNVIAPTAELGGTRRSFDPRVREQRRAELERTLAAACERYGARYQLELEPGYPVLV